jgi:PKD repeat protein
MKKLSILLFLLIAVSLSSFSQETKHPRKVIKPAHFDISKKLSEIEPIPPGQRDRSWKNNIVKNYDNFLDEFKNEPEVFVADPALQNSTKGLGTPTITKNFPGVSNLSGIAPPDTDGDVGPNHYFQMINLAFCIWDKDGNQLMSPADNQTLWEGFDNGQPFDNANDGDPIVLYDEYSDRWIATQFAYSTNNGKSYELIALSATADPLGEWYRYAYEFDYLPDYPKFGIWPDGYYFSINQFDDGDWIGGGICAVDRDAMLAGDPDAEMVFFDMGSSYGSLLPADVDGEMLPPEGAPQYFLSMGSSHLKLWEVDIDWDNTANSTTTYKGVLETEYFTTNDIAIKQPGTSQELASLSGRLMYRLQYRNFGDYEVMVTNHTVKVDDNGRAGVRWYELRKYPEGEWEIYQQGTYAPEDGNSRWMASAAMNDVGDIAIGYSVSGSSTYPSIRFAGQLAGAAMGLGVLDIEETSIKQGTKSQTGLDRWGDYASMSVDPSDGITFWFTSEWTNGGWSWKTQIAAFDLSQPPYTEFEASEETIPTGGNVNFGDLSGGNPGSWEWTFEGGNPSSSTEQNPQNIVYDSEGSYNVTLTATNDVGTTELLKEDFINVSSTILPLVEFDLDLDVSCLDDVIHFTDQTQYSPIEWNWEFTPSTIEFADGTNANSQNPSVIFQEAGQYSVSLTATNLNGSASVTKTDLIKAGGFMPTFDEDFEVDGLKTNYWSVENPDDDITWEIYETGGTEPGNHAAAIKLNEYFPVGDRDRLITPPFNLEGLDNTVLEFQHAYAKRHTKKPDSLIVYASTGCGNNWVKVFADAENGSDGNFATHERTPEFWPETASDWCMEGWGATCIVINLDAWAGEPDVRLAFESYNEQGNPLFIDNVKITQFVGNNENIQENDFLVYPNPSIGTFHIQLPENNNYKSAQLFNQFGQVIYEREINKDLTNFDIKLDEKLSKGIYYLKVEGLQLSTTKKLIIY